MPSRRLFLADPMCVFDHGHNPQSLLYYQSYFAGRHFDVYPLVCRLFAANDGGYALFERSFDYYYQQFMPIGSVSNERSAKLGRTHRATFKARSSEKPALASDPLEILATLDWLAIFEKHGITGDDFIFYPFVDFYGCVGLLRALKSRPTLAPSIHLRFIGVMENAAANTIAPLEVLGGLLREADPQLRIELSTETPSYSSHLAEILKRKVDVTFCPTPVETLPLPTEPPYQVYLAGSGRMEKGFDRMLALAARYAEEHSRHDVIFTMHALPARQEPEHLNYTSQLYAAPNIQLIECVQSDAQMLENYRSCSFSILPYWQQNYRLRGSAAISEGVARCRPLAISAHTGFHSLVDEFESAYNCASEGQFCDAIATCYSKSPDEMFEVAVKSARRFEEISRASMRRVFAASANELER